MLQTLTSYILPHTDGMSCDAAFSQAAKKGYKSNVGAATLIFGYRCDIITAETETKVTRGCSAEG